MSESELQNLLLIGMDVNPPAYSAVRAGYRVYAVDYFGDLDLRRVADNYFSIIEQKESSSCGRLNVDFSVETLLQGARKISERNRIDAILLSAGLDDSPKVLFELCKIAPVIGNSPESIQRVRDTERLADELRWLGVRFPSTALADDLQEAKRASRDIGYPLLVKPRGGFGGTGIRKAETPRKLERIFEELYHHRQRVVIQEYIPGIAASASVVSSGGRSLTLTVNEQLVGLRSFGHVEPFGYCGNIVPLSAPEDMISMCRKQGEKVVTHFKLVGSNGVDFVISAEGFPYVVEVNPRFQATLECVEKALSINVIEAHMKACTKALLPDIPQRTQKSCTRLILFAHRRSAAPDLRGIPEVRDVPIPGVIIEKGEPVCSIVAEGRDRDSSFEEARNIAQSIRSSLKPVQTNAGI